MINPIGSSQAELPPDEADLGAAGDGEDASAATSVTGLSYDGGSHSSVSHSRLLFGGGVAHASIEGDGGGQTVEVHGGFSGEVNGRGGTDGFVAHAGSTVSDATVRGGAGDDGIVQHAGATFRDVELLGGDGGDMLRLGGHNERVAMDPGDNEEAPDEIVLQDTVTGDLKARDGESWWQKPKDGSEGGLDLVQLMGDWRETGDGYALAGADGETLAELGIEGDADHLENIASYDAATGEMIVQFQAIDPEIKYDSMWAKAAGTVLKYGGVVVGVFAPPVGVAMSVGGQALLTAHAVDNNIDTTGTWVQMGLSAAPFMGAAGGHVGSALNTGYAASQGNVSGALLGGAGFLPAGAFRDAANTAGYSIGAGKLLDEGRFGDAFLYGATAGVSAGLIDADGTVHDGAKFASNLYNGAETVIDGEFDLGTVGALLRHGGQLPGNLGLDDDRDFGATTGLLGGFADGMSYGIESDRWRARLHRGGRGVRLPPTAFHARRPRLLRAARPGRLSGLRRRADGPGLGREQPGRSGVGRPVRRERRRAGGADPGLRGLPPRARRLEGRDDREVRR